MIIERFCYSPFCVMGKLILGDLVLWTVEKPWRNNEVRQSCVPEGEYSLEPHNSDKHRDTWALIGETVSHWPNEGKQRSACVFHVGNTAKDVNGCIAPGLTLNENDWGVVSSRRAMEAFRKEIYATQTRSLLISHYNI